MDLTLYGNTDYRLLVLLARARDALLKVRKAELDEYRVSPIEALALFSIDDLRNKTTAAELSRKMRRQHNTVMALLRRMEKKGLVNKVKDEEKRNVWRISLTKAGKAACRRAKRLDSVHQVMSIFTESQKKELESCLNVICDVSLRELNDGLMAD